MEQLDGPIDALSIELDGGDVGSSGRVVSGGG